MLPTPALGQEAAHPEGHNAELREQLDRIDQQAIALRGEAASAIKMYSATLRNLAGRLATPDPLLTGGLAPRSLPGRQHLVTLGLAQRLGENARSPPGGAIRGPARPSIAFDPSERLGTTLSRPSPVAASVAVQRSWGWWRSIERPQTSKPIWEVRPSAWLPSTTGAARLSS
jgi:hypothetical protein